MKFSTIFFLISLLACNELANSNQYSSRFSSFKSRFGKKYSSRAEEIQRFEKFSNVLSKIDKHNEDFEKGLTTYTRDVNQFADMFDHEIFQNTGLKETNYESLRTKRYVSATKYWSWGPFNGTKYYEYTATDTEKANAPKSIDWTLKGFDKPVQDQGGCGSCWAFAGSAAVDAAFKIQKNRTVATSQQEIVDCFEGGCQGGGPEFPIMHAIRNGVKNENDYPYTSGNTGKRGVCNSPAFGSTNKLSGFVVLYQRDEDSVKTIVSKLGPCVTSIDVEEGFFGYKSGVYDAKIAGTNSSECSPEKGSNHAVLIVGYGTDENGVDYWKIRNSWSEYWGEKGHMRIARNKGNLCQIGRLVTCPIS